MKKLNLLIIFVLAVCANAANLRIDLETSGEMSFKDSSNGLKIEKANWVEDKTKTRLIVSATPSTSWQDFSFTVTPKKDGDIIIFLMSDSKTDTDLANFDSFVIQGSSIKNGDFEIIDNNQSPQYWDRGWGKKIHVINETNADNSKNVYIGVNHNSPALQIIKAKANQDIKIQFKAKSPTK